MDNIAMYRDFGSNDMNKSREERESRACYLKYLSGTLNTQHICQKASGFSISSVCTLSDLEPRAFRGHLNGSQKHAAFSQACSKTSLLLRGAMP